MTESIGNHNGSFYDSFMFSVHTVSTIGYGYLFPKGNLVGLVVTIESFLGVLQTAIITGLFFAKFSIPRAKLMFTEKALITNFEGKRVFLLRMINSRGNRIVDAKMHLTMMRKKPGREHFKEMIKLELFKSYSPIFALGFFMYHEITPESPLYGITNIEELKKIDASFFVSIFGVDSTMNSPVNTNKEYSYNDIEFDKEFADAIFFNKGKATIDYDKFNKVEE